MKVNGMHEFLMKTKVVFHDQANEAVAALKGKSALIVHDPIMRELGFCDKIREKLAAAGFSTVTLQEVRPEPDVELVAGILYRCEQDDADTVIAIGGGAAIDTAKAVLYFSMQRGGAKRRPQFVAIPSTTGTGSEVTDFSVITVNGAKKVLIDDALAPNLAVLNADYLKSLPQPVIADSGMDALSHGIEAYVSCGASDYTDALAEKAVALVFKWLPVFYADPSNTQARKHMQNASCMAGMAFTNSNLGINHSLSHAVGARFHIPHGRAIALLMEQVIAYNGGICVRRDSSAAKKYQRLAERIGLPARTPREGTLQIIYAVQRLKKELGMPDRLSAIRGVTKEALGAAESELIGLALEDRCTPGNPVSPKAEELSVLLEKAYEGKFL